MRPFLRRRGARDGAGGSGTGDSGKVACVVAARGGASRDVCRRTTRLTDPGLEICSVSPGVKEARPKAPTVSGRADYAQAALANPDGVLRRVGNTIVFGRPDGGEQVIAFIEQTAPRLDHVERAVGGLLAGQDALSASLQSVQTLSMVTLGLSGLSSGVLGVQFLALNRRLGELGQQVAHLHKKFDAAVTADLKAGLDLLRQGQDFLEAGDQANAHSRLTAALPYCLRTMKYFGELLGTELNRNRADRDEVRLLACHLAVAVGGVASCQVGLEQDRHAFGQSAEELGLLRRAAGVIFGVAVARDPAAFMHPALHQHGVTPSSSWRNSTGRRATPALSPRRRAARRRRGSRSTGAPSSTPGGRGAGGTPGNCCPGCARRSRRSRRRTASPGCHGSSRRCGRRAGARSQ
jgi:hypothetical protein